MSDKNAPSTEDKAKELFRTLSPEAQEIVGEVLQLEQEQRNLKRTKGIKSAIVTAVEAIVR